MKDKTGRVFKSGIALPYCISYPAFPSLTLARLIYKENASAFNHIEDARDAVRYVRGKRGKENKERATAAFAPYFDKEERAKNPYVLPDSWAHPKEVYKLPTGNNRIGFISDAQVPFHDNDAIEASYAWLKKRGVNTLLINGDWIDFYGLSHFQKDPRDRDFKQEYNHILQSFEHLRHHFPNIDIFYNLQANHELRYEKFMMLKAPELLSLKLPEMDLESVLRLRLFEIRPIKRVDHIKIGNLPALHGHTIFTGQTSPVSTARTVFMKTNQSAIASHCHQTNEYTSKTLEGKLMTTWTTGCLMNLNVEYNPHNNKYNHGFAYIETDKNGDFHVENKRIDNGRVL